MNVRLYHSCCSKMTMVIYFCNMSCKQDKFWIEIVLIIYPAVPNRKKFLGEWSHKPILGVFWWPRPSFHVWPSDFKWHANPSAAFWIDIILLFLLLPGYPCLINGLLLDFVFLHQSAHVYSFFKLCQLKSNHRLTYSKQPNPKFSKDYT